MLEVLSESVELVNLPFTILLGGLLVYWLLVAVGFTHFDGGADVHAEAAGDLHAHAHADAHAPAGANGHGDHGGSNADSGHHGPGFLTYTAHFLNIGEVPVMIVLSVLTLWMWLLSMVANHYFNPGSVWRALAFLIPNAALALVLTRYATWPMKKFFLALNREYEEHKPLIGRTCRMITSEVSADFGQAQIDTKGAPLLINVRVADGSLLRKGETGLIVREDKQKNLYYVVKVTAETLEA